MRLQDTDLQADRVDSAIKRFHFSLKESQHLRASKSNIGKAAVWRCLNMFEERNVSMGLWTPANTFNFQQRHYRTELFVCFELFNL